MALTYFIMWGWFSSVNMLISVIRAARSSSESFFFDIIFTAVSLPEICCRCWNCPYDDELHIFWLFCWLMLKMLIRIWGENIDLSVERYLVDGQLHHWECPAAKVLGEGVLLGEGLLHCWNGQAFCVSVKWPRLTFRSVRAPCAADPRTRPAPFPRDCPPFWGSIAHRNALRSK